MAVKDLNILYKDYVNNCKHSNIIPLCMLKWYDKFYCIHKHKKYNTIEEVLKEINEIRMSSMKPQ